MLLLDQNLSPRLVASLRGEFPDSVHVGSLGLASAPDRVIWDYAREQRLAIVTKDADFTHLSALYGAPPWVVWLRVGNRPTDSILNILLAHRMEIRQLLSSSVSTLIIDP